MDTKIPVTIIRHPLLLEAAHIMPEAVDLLVQPGPEEHLFLNEDDQLEFHGDPQTLAAALERLGPEPGPDRPEHAVFSTYQAIGQSAWASAEAIFDEAKQKLGFDPAQASHAFSNLLEQIHHHDHWKRAIEDLGLPEGLVAESRGLKFSLTYTALGEVYSRIVAGYEYAGRPVTLMLNPSEVLYDPYRVVFQHLVVLRDVLVPASRTFTSFIHHPQVRMYVIKYLLK